MKLIIILLITINSVFAVMQVAISNSQIKHGVELAGIERQLEEIKKESRIVETSLAKQSSMAAVENSAKNQGLIVVKTTSLPDRTVATNSR